MTRSPPLVIAAALALLAGCSGAQEAGNTTTAADEAVADGNTVEDLPSDGLAAPADMPLETESNTAGSASGGNAM